MRLRRGPALKLEEVAVEFREGSDDLDVRDQEADAVEVENPPGHGHVCNNGAQGVTRKIER